MTFRLFHAVAVLAVSLAAACGAPGEYDLCQAGCDSFYKCRYYNDAQLANCQTDCNNNKGKSSDDDAQLAKDCKNAGDIRKQQSSCYDNTSCRSNVTEYTAALGACVLDPQVNNCVKQ